MAATLTSPGTVLSHTSAAAASGFWSLETTVPRTLLDLAPRVYDRPHALLEFAPPNVPECMP
jgi:hypothetical protein